jgi:MFS family permease
MKRPEPSLVSSLRALPPAAWILFFGMFLNKFGAFVVPFLALYLTRTGHTLTDAGLAIGAYGIGNFIASLLGGHLADTVGRRKTILLSMFSGAAVMILLSQARSLPWIIALAALTGLTNEFYRPACSALLTDLVAPEQRVTAFAAFRMAFNAGWAFGPATAGFLAAKGFFWLFAGDAATSVLFGLVALLALPRDAGPRRRERGWGEAAGVIGRDRRFRQVILASLAVSFIFMQMTSSFGVQVTNLGFSAANYGALISLNGALVVCCELPLTTLTRRLPARQVLAAGYLLVGAGFALNALAHTVPALTACMLLLTLGEMTAMPVQAAYVSNLAPAHLRGRYVGVFGLNWALALIIAPALGLKMLAYNPALLWFGGGALGVLAAGIILMEVRVVAVPVVVPEMGGLCDEKTGVKIKGASAFQTSCGEISKLTKSDQP